LIKMVDLDLAEMKKKGWNWEVGTKRDLGGRWRVVTDCRFEIGNPQGRWVRHSGEIVKQMV
jgi:hypothetical protein